MWNWLKKKAAKHNKETLQETFDEHEDYELIIRKPNDVAERILALLGVIGKVHQNGDSKYLEWLDKHSIKNYLSRQETYFVNTDKPEHNLIVNFSWKAESLVSLFWAINLISDMPALNQEFDIYSVNGIRDIIENPEQFKSTITLRSDKELKEMEGELFDQHWRVRDAQLFNKEMPQELNPSVVYERRYGLSWLVGYGDDWDDVPTDT